jgi:sulfite reductase (ferredoxin)
VSKVNNEELKARSRGLRGEIADELAAPTDAFGAESIALLKFHGIYQQDDRDARKSAREIGAGKAFSFMIRTKNPGGYIPRASYLAIDRLADEYGNGTIRVTTRQGLQLHGVRKADLKTVVAGINAHLGTTLGACGDINRNVMAPPFPFVQPAYRIAREAAAAIADLLTPKTGAYYEIWQDGELVSSTQPEPDSIYGATYLPRKFKIAVAVAGDNSVDLYANDVGVVPILNRFGALEGYDVLAGGGLGTTHNKPETFARVADEIGFVEPHQLLEVVRAIVIVQRDNGDRANRRHARLKYLIADRGVDWFRGAVEAESGVRFAEWRPLPPWTIPVHNGWHEQGDGRWFYGVAILSGRIADGRGVRRKSALREIVSRFTLDLIATPDQSLLLIDVAPADRAAIDAVLRAHGVPEPADQRPIERHALACPALPTCGLALAESERILPQLLGDIERELAAASLDPGSVTIRVTGCPNGCARPYLAEIGIVGVSLDRYNVYLGGNSGSTRPNTLFAEKVALAAIAPALRPIIGRYAAERLPDESFGDFSARTIAFVTA